MKPRFQYFYDLTQKEIEDRSIYFSDVSLLMQAADYGIADAQYMLAKCIVEFEIPTYVTQEDHIINSDHKANPKFYDEQYAMSYLEKALDNNNWISSSNKEYALYYRNWILDGKPED